MLGAPYAVGGRSLEGIDCLGVVVRFFAKMGVEIHDPLTGDREDILTSAFADQFIGIKAADRLDFDLAVIKGQGDPQHLGVFYGGKILHATRGAGVVFARVFGVHQYFRSKAMK